MLKTFQVYQYRQEHKYNPPVEDREIETDDIVSAIPLNNVDVALNPTFLVTLSDGSTVNIKARFSDFDFLAERECLQYNDDQGMTLYTGTGKTIYLKSSDDLDVSELLAWAKQTRMFLVNLWNQQNWSNFELEYLLATVPFKPGGDNESDGGSA